MHGDFLRKGGKDGDQEIGWKEAVMAKEEEVAETERE